MDICVVKDLAEIQFVFADEMFAARCAVDSIKTDKHIAGLFPVCYHKVLFLSICDEPSLSDIIIF